MLSGCGTCRHDYTASMKRLLLAVCVLATSSATASISNAATSSAVDRAAGSISHDFMSPYCPGLLLADCRSDAAVALRTDIHARLEAGQSEEQVRQDLEAVYGEKLRAAPAASGFGLVAWVTPFLTLALGAVLATRWVLANRTSGRVGDVPQEALSPRNRARLDEELSRAGVGHSRRG